MTLALTGHYRLNELHYVLESIAEAQSVSLVGVSNIGKSDLLRDLCRSDSNLDLNTAEDVALRLFYIDCNRMLDQSEHGFYELVLRVLIADLSDAEPELVDQLQQAYNTLLAPPTEFHIPLSFNQALTTLIERNGRRSVFVFDEFDTAYEALDARVFLNLRALKDRYGKSLAYLIATDRRLAHIRSGEQVDEFKELFEQSIHYVKPLDEADTRLLIASHSEALGATFDDNDIQFIRNQSGGHPSLTDIVCRRLATITGEARRSDSEDWLIHREIRDVLRDDIGVSAECHKIWRDLTEQEQDTLMELFQPGDGHSPLALKELRSKGMIIGEEGDLDIFARLFEDFVQRQSVAAFGPEKGVRVDVDSGIVVVDGRLIETLTNLEYRLLLLLYGRLNKICDKYSIVEAVWGEDYVDEIYDSSIEKLVSRLRKKIEPDPSSPKFLITVRGRGYKLAG